MRRSTISAGCPSCTSARASRLSAFRVEKLNRVLESRSSSVRVAATCVWHLVEAARDLTPAERADLDGRAAALFPRVTATAAFSPRA